MKFKLYILILVSLFSFLKVMGQTDHVKIYLNNNSLKNVCDSLYKNKSSIDNQTCFSIYKGNTDSVLILLFNVQEAGVVHGFYRKNYKTGSPIEFGNYYLDSIWSFRNKPRLKDSVSDFSSSKIGTWKYFHSLGNRQVEYKKIYDTDSLYKENWYYDYDKILKESVYHQRKGLVSEMFYNYYGEIEYYFLKTKSGKFEVYFDDNDVSHLSFDNELFSYDVMTENSSLRRNRYNPYEGMNVDMLFDAKGKLIQKRIFYPDGTLKFLFDYPNNLRIEYNEKGKIVSQVEIKE